jgi:hypothetical protein
MSPGARWPYRVDATRWDTVRDDLDAYAAPTVTCTASWCSRSRS